MNKLPQQFWGVLIAGMGCLLAIVALFANAEKDIKIAVIGLGAGLATGALGYIGSHKEAANPTTPETPAPTK